MDGGRTYPAPFWLTLASAAGYLLHLLDESRFGLPYEPRYVGPALICLAAAVLGIVLRRPLVALPAALLAGLLVAYFGGIGHLFPVGAPLMPLTLWDGWGGPLLALNAAVGLTTAGASAGHLVQRTQARRAPT